MFSDLSCTFHAPFMHLGYVTVLVVKLEDLKTDLIGQVKRMLNFLKFPYMEDELRSRLANFGGHMVHKIFTKSAQFDSI